MSLSLHKEDGSVLVLVLIFMQICLLLTLYEVRSNHDNTLIRHQLYAKSQLHDQAVIELTNVENLLSANQLSGEINPISDSDFESLPITWWQRYAKHISNQTADYYVVYENEGNRPCTQVRINENQVAIANYNRITLLAVLHATTNLKVMLQETYVTPVMTSVDCQATVDFTTMGRLARYDL